MPLRASSPSLPPLPFPPPPSTSARLPPRAPQELLLLREFVEQHLQQSRDGASAGEIEQRTAAWTVTDVGKLPEELRTCCVCLEDVCAGQPVRTLPCLHTFHAQCAEEWLKKKKTCPLCQFDIVDGADGGSSSQEA